MRSSLDSQEISRFPNKERASCQGLRPRRVEPPLAMTQQLVLPSTQLTVSAPGISDFRGSMAGLHVPLPTLRPCPRGRDARLGADADRYSFVVSDLHQLLLAGLPAH